VSQGVARDCKQLKRGVLPAAEIGFLTPETNPIAFIVFIGLKRKIGFVSDFGDYPAVVHLLSFKRSGEQRSPYAILAVSDLSSSTDRV
jgi:hypothetical protein